MISSTLQHIESEDFIMEIDETVMRYFPFLGRVQVHEVTDDSNFVGMNCEYYHGELEVWAREGASGNTFDLLIVHGCEELFLTVTQEFWFEIIEKMEIR